MSRNRGIRLQEALAAYLRDSGWLHAESNPPGRKGADIMGTPGIAWENKTADDFRVLEFVRQAKGNAAAGDVPVVVYWPRGAGEKSAAHTLAIVPLAALVELFREAGCYGI